MEVYIEYVIIDNIVVNYILLKVAIICCGYNIKKKNILFSSLIGTLFVIFMPLLIDFDILILLYRFLVAVVMVLCLKKYNNLRDIVSLFFVLVVLTFLFGGMLIATLSIFDIVYTSSGLLFLNFEIPISTFVLPIFMYAIITIRVVRFLTNKIKIGRYMYDIEFIKDGKSYRLKAFLDTGNNLFDVDGRPVIVMELKTFFDIYNDITALQFVNNDMHCMLNNVHYLNVSTVLSCENMMAFDAEAIIVNNGKQKTEYKSICVAVSKSNFNDYNLILHRNFC